MQQTYNRTAKLKNMILENQSEEPYKVTVEIFEGHYRRFKPVLDQISSRNREPFHNLESTRSFVRNDLTSLVTRPYNATERRNFLESIQQGHESLPRIQDYRKALQGLGNPTETLAHLADYYTSNTEAVNLMFSKSRRHLTRNIPQTADFNKAVDLLADRTSLCTDAQVEALVHFSENYEQFALVTTEPYMYLIMGNTLFFGTFLQMHRQGIFHIYITRVAQKRLELLNTWENRLTRTLRRLNDIGNALLPLIEKVLKIVIPSSTLAGMGLRLFTQNRSNPLETITPPTQETTIARDLVNNHLRGDGFNNYYLDNFRDRINRGSFELGRFSASTLRGFMQGVASRHINELEIAATELDRRRDEARRREDH